VRAFEKLYEGRDRTKYSLNNPMRRFATTSIPSGSIKDTFEKAQFPIQYRFNQNQKTGVVNRTFDNTANPSSTTTYFYLENYSSRKVLGVRGNDCTSGLIEVQERSASLYQQWSLTDEGHLKHRSCSTKSFLSNRHDSCTSGNELALSSSGEKWTFQKDGKIVHNKCKSRICKAMSC
jgi:hypothetical protein